MMQVEPKEVIEIKVDGSEDVPLLAWMLIAYEAGEASQVPGRLIMAVCAGLAGFLAGVTW